MDEKSWAKQLRADEREVFELGASLRAPPGAKQAIWSGLVAKLPAAAAAAGGATAASALTASSLLKPLALGLALGSATATGMAAYDHLTHVAAPAAVRSTPRGASAPAAPAVAHERSPESPRQETPALSAAPATRTAPAPDPGVAVHAPPPSEAAPPNASVRSFPAEAPAPEPENALLVESRGVAAARAALRAGDPRTTLARLDELDRRFQNGMLAQERLALRIEALSALGQRDAARALATRFLERYPQSPHAPAITRMLR